MKRPIRVLMASESCGWGPEDGISDYVEALLDADGAAIFHTGDFHDLSKENADLIAAAVNAYEPTAEDSAPVAHSAEHVSTVPHEIRTDDALAAVEAERCMTNNEPFEYGGKQRRVLSVRTWRNWYSGAVYTIRLAPLRFPT
jgi:hypothetical protein